MDYSLCTRISYRNEDVNTFIDDFIYVYKGEIPLQKLLYEENTNEGFVFTPETGLKAGTDTTKTDALAGTFTLPSGYTLESTLVKSDEAHASDIDKFKIDGVQLKFAQDITVHQTYKVRVFFKETSSGIISYKDVEVSVGEDYPSITGLGYTSPYTFTYGDEEISKDSTSVLASANVTLSGTDNGNTPYSFDFLTSDGTTTYTDQDKFLINDSGEITVKDNTVPLSANANGYKLLVEVTDARGQKATQEVIIKVNKANQTIAITNGDEQFVLDQEVAITVGGRMSGESAGSNTYSIVSGDAAIISANDAGKYQMKKAGTFKLRAVIPGDDNYNEATVEKDITLSDLPVQDTLSITSTDRTWGDTNNTFTPAASGGSGDGAILWSIISGSDVASYDADTGEITILKAGTFKLQAKKDGNGVYQNAKVEKDIVVSPMEITVTPKKITKPYGQFWQYVTTNGVDLDVEPLTGDEIGTPVISLVSGFNETTAVGTYPQATIASGYSHNNYTFVYNKGSLEVTETILTEPTLNTYYRIKSGAAGNNGWYTTPIVLESMKKDGYQYLSSSQTDLTGSEVTISTEGEQDNSLYMKHTDGTLTNAITYHSKIDTKKPTLSFSYASKSRNVFQRALNSITFDQMFKDEQVLTFVMSDPAGGSGIDTTSYTIVELNEDGTEIAGTSKSGTGTNVNLAKNKIYKISASARDLAGNESKTVTQTVQISDQVSEITLDAKTIDQGNEQTYTSGTWTKHAIKVTPLSDTTMVKWTYKIGDGTIQDVPSSGSVTFENDTALQETVTFYGEAENGVTSSNTIDLAIDPVVPAFTLSAKDEQNQTVNDGQSVSSNVTFTTQLTSTNVSGATLSVSTDEGATWTTMNAPITVSSEGTHSYWFKAQSGAGMESPIQKHSFTIQKPVSGKPQIQMNSGGSSYTSGTWAREDVVIALSGGNEFEVWSGATQTIPANAKWEPVNNASYTMHENTTGTYVYFRIKGNNDISDPIKVMIDQEIPTKPVLTIQETHTDVVSRMLRMISFGAWMNEGVDVTYSSQDSVSGIDHYEVIQTVDGVEKRTTSKDPSITFSSDINAALQVRAYDVAGNVSAFSDEKQVLIDTTPPIIQGAVQDRIYHLPYLMISYEDEGSGIKQATYENNGETKPLSNHSVITGNGIVHIVVEDEAGNTTERSFTLTELPDLDSIGCDSSSESIISAIQSDYAELKTTLTSEQKTEIETWLANTKKTCTITNVEHDVTIKSEDGKIPSDSELVVEIITTDVDESTLSLSQDEEVKVAYDLFLQQNGTTLRELDGSAMEIRLPLGAYKGMKDLRLLELHDDGTIKEVAYKVDGDDAVFTTTKLMKYAFVGMKNKVNIDTDQDGKPDINIDLNGDGKPDLNLDTSGDGVPNINIDTNGDGKADYNVDLNGDKLPDLNIGPLKKPWEPTKCTIQEGVEYCSDPYREPYLNIDTNDNLRPDLNVDLTGDKEANINIDTDFDLIPNVDIDDIGDGEAHVNADLDGDGKADKNIMNLAKWTPNLNVDQPIPYDTMTDLNADEETPPVDPDIPSDPSDPDVPTNPTDPTEPIDPSNPNQPEDPSNPVNPIDPDSANNPDDTKPSTDLNGTQTEPTDQGSNQKTDKTGVSTGDSTSLSLYMFFLFVSGGVMLLHKKLKQNK